MRRFLSVLRRSSHSETRQTLTLCRPDSLLQPQQQHQRHHQSGHRSFSTLASTGLSSYGPSFGIAFDIDGVVLRGRTPIGGSPGALRRLYTDDGTLKIPFLFLTNGGGIPESKRASELSGLLKVDISPLQVVQGHSPFKGLVGRFKNELIVAVGKGEPAEVMSEYGFKKVLSIDEYASYFDDIDPLSQYKTWTTRWITDKSTNSKPRDLHPRHDAHRRRVQAAFVVSDPVDWGRDIQVLCDILRSGGLPGEENGNQPPLFFAADDLEYQAAFPSERLGMGAFRLALECIFNRINHDSLEYTSFGKPNPFVFKNAEAILKQLRSNIFRSNQTENVKDIQGGSFKTIYMVGDNPSVDIKGAKKAGHPWFCILTRTGVFRGKENHSQFPADLVCFSFTYGIERCLSLMQPHCVINQDTDEVQFYGFQCRIYP